MLSNGVRVLLFPNKTERNKIMVNARFGRGYRGLSSEEEGLAWSGALALMASGVGNLGQEELDKITTGRRIGLSFDIDNDAFEITADTRGCGSQGSIASYRRQAPISALGQSPGYPWPRGISYRV